MTSKANFGTGKAHLLVCCFCGTPIEGLGANPDTSPVRWGKKLSPKRCCRRCDIERVIPARMGLAPWCARAPTRSGWAMEAEVQEMHKRLDGLPPQAAGPKSELFTMRPTYSHWALQIGAHNASFASLHCEPTPERGVGYPRHQEAGLREAAHAHSGSF